MFDFSNSNKNQKQAISAVDGPVLIIAGPGTGKTYTLVQRAIYLIQEKGVKPEEIFMATFTEKAAKELVTRITNELATRNIVVNIQDMYVGTFHSLCLRILKDHLEYTRLKKNYRLLDTFDQGYMVFQNIRRFREIPGYEELFEKGGAWRQATEICGNIGNLSEELVDVGKMLKAKDAKVKALANVYVEYQKLLTENNWLDFAAIQVECFRMLTEHKDILEELQHQLKYIMIDEYQDTNYIQEQLVFLLAGKKKNICVVGDDDQGLYRFRGATIRNILEFPSHFAKGKCQIVKLDVNYRSNSDIVDFYNKWMKITSGRDFKFTWGKYRYEKAIKANKKSALKSLAVVKLTSENDEEEWYEKIYLFIQRLKKSKKIKDYNQIAFLFSSVKNERVVALAQYLESKGINVYSPRSDMFFQRDEVKLLLGCLLLMFPGYISDLELGNFKYLQPKNVQYYRECVQAANAVVKKRGNAGLKSFIRERGEEHHGLTGTTNYAYSGLLYQLFNYEPFKSILDVDLGSGLVDVRPARNLAVLTQLIGKYEYIHRMSVLSAKYIKRNTEWLFNTYFRLLFDGGIAEYEDDSEYAPSGCVSFLTIHQAKGMEFPIVVVDSLGNGPRKQQNEIMSIVENKYFNRPAFEPFDQTKFFDFWRLYYTAFSRAQDLLILTCNENNRTPSKYFEEVYEELPNVSGPDFNLSEFTFKPVKDVNLKDMFSFTSHITVYETCALQYKFYKELEFMPVRAGAMVFGSLVHETIEDIHRAALRHEEATITPEHIEEWFALNYATLSKTEHTYLAPAQQEAALKQVERYAYRQKKDWSAIQDAEVDVSLVQPDYIIEGKIDLIRGEKDTVEIVDFKSEQKPDLVSEAEKIERYKRQLHIYAYLVEKRYGKKVSKMHLYYTAEENGNPMISFPYKKTAIDSTMKSFDTTVKKIMGNDFSKCSNSAKVCKNCDFRYYCQR
jgi:DNA helicase-2/ATP-dependent DNA helicase PcrA